MAGMQKGVAKKIRDEELRVVFTHFYEHSLDFAVSDTIKKSRFLNNSLITVNEIKLVRYSPRRENLFNAIKDDIAPGILIASRNSGIRVLLSTMIDCSYGLHGEYSEELFCSSGVVGPGSFYCP